MDEMDDLYDDENGGDEDFELPDIEYLCDVYGEELVAYSVGAPLDEDEWGLMRMGHLVLSDAVEVVVQELIGLASRSTRRSGTAAYEHLCRYDSDLNGSRANHFRSRCGVSLNRVEVSDYPVDILLTMLRDTYPVLLIGSPSHIEASNIGMFVRAHPLWGELATAMSDDTLARLSVDANDGRASMWSTGHTTAYNTDSIGVGLLWGACERHVLDGTRASNWLDFQADLEALSAQLARCVAEGRPLAEGGSILLPILIGVTDIRLNAPHIALTSTGDHIRSGGSSLLPLPTTASPILEHGVTATVVLDEKFRRLGPVDEAPRRQPKGTARNALEHEMSPSDSSIDELRSVRQHRLDAARLAMVMVAGPPYEAAPPVLSVRVVSPMGPHGFATEYYLEETPLLVEGVGRPPGRLTGLDERLYLSTAHGETLRTCYESIVTLDGSMHFGVRRLMSALVNKLDITSGIVDGVMCWENALGGRPDGGERQHDITKPLLSAVASALQPDERGARNRLRNELGDLYQLRSRTVHGQLRPGREAELRLSRTKVLDIAVRLIALIASDPVLACAPKGSDRAREVQARVTVA